MSAEKRPIGRIVGLFGSLLGCFVGLILVAAQCSGPTPPLPVTPSPSVRVRVAVLTPMTGELGTFGELVRNGVTLAFDEWNDRGGSNDHFIEYILEDTRCDPLEARRVAERTIDQQGTRFLVGGVCSEEAIPIARVADERGVLFIAATATHPLVTVDDGGVTRRMVFRASFPYPYQGRAAARFALDVLQARRATVLTNSTDDFVSSLTDEFRTVFEAGGGRVVTLTYLPEGSVEGSRANFETIIADVAQTESQVVYVPDAYPVANRVGSLIRERELAVTLIGSELWDNGALDLSALQGAYFTLHYSGQNPDVLAQAWKERYLSAFAVEPDTLAALGYDAASLLTLGLERAVNRSPGDVARSLETIEFEGVTGRWRFDAGHNPLKPVVIARIQGGKVVFDRAVYP